MKLTLNDKARNHYKLMNFANLEIPEDEAEQIAYCENLVNRLKETETLLIDQHSKKGYLFELGELDGVYYLANCIRTEVHDIYVVTIYANDCKNDSIALFNFLKKNIGGAVKMLKTQIKDAKKGAKNLKIVDAFPQSDTKNIDNLPS